MRKLIPLTRRQFTWADIPICARASQLEKDLGRPGTATKNYKNLEWRITKPKMG